ncbi:hypothetical protein FRB94_013699 [Tulasnella sp. JGI-2019a]|nr:hypothetical protein FRB94_013699 [Tulasnella sp. JGI-2019a]
MRILSITVLVGIGATLTAPPHKPLSLQETIMRSTHWQDSQQSLYEYAFYIRGKLAPASWDIIVKYEKECADPGYTPGTWIVPEESDHMKEEISTWASKEASHRALWFLWRLMYTPSERYLSHSHKPGYRLKPYWILLIGINEKKFRAPICESVLGMDLDSEQLGVIFQGIRDYPIMNYVASQWFHVNEKRIIMGPAERLADFHVLTPPLKLTIELAVMGALRSSGLLLTLRQVDQLSGVIADLGTSDIGWGLPVLTDKKIATWNQENPESTYSSHQITPVEFGFNDLDWEYKVVLRELVRVVETGRDQFKATVIDPGYL